MKPTFHVALTADFRDDTGKLKFPDIGLSVLDAHPHIRHRFFKNHQKEIAAEQIGDAQAVIVLTPYVTAASVSKTPNLLVIARFGVGYDSVDVKACTAAGVLVTITVGAVDRPVAEAAIGWMIALSHNMLAKDRLVQHRPMERALQIHGLRIARPHSWCHWSRRHREENARIIERIWDETAAGFRSFYQPGSGN